VPGGPVQLHLRRESLGLDLGDPGADDRPVGAGVESGAVPGEALVALRQALACRAGLDHIRIAIRLARRLEGFERLVDVGWVEHLCQPAVERADDRVLAEVHVAGVVDLVDDGVLTRVAASVVGEAVVVAALHQPPADGAADEAAQREGSWRRATLAHHMPAASRRGDRARPAEQLVRHDRLVGERAGVDPLARVVPAHLRLVTEPRRPPRRALVAPLAVPDLMLR